MRIHHVEFAGAIGRIGQEEPASVRRLKQVAFSGRSNVGKSSLINRLLGRTRTPIARVSKQPGKTQEINFYRVEADLGVFCLVDLPGYGFAKVPTELRSKWRPLIEGFLVGSDDLAGVVQLIDIRHGPTPDDRRAVEYLTTLELPVLFALTKSDKLASSKIAAAVKSIAEDLGADQDQVLAVSAQKGSGIDTLTESVSRLVF